MLGAQAVEPRLEALGLRRLAVDLGDAAVALDQVEQALDQRALGAGEQRVDGGDARRSERQARAQRGPVDASPRRPPGAPPRGRSDSCRSSAISYLQ